MNNQPENTQNEEKKLTSEEKRLKVQGEVQKNVPKAAQPEKGKVPFKFTRKRDGRVAFKKRRKLDFAHKKDGLYYHWMNEGENDFLQLKEDGYAFVDEKNKQPRDAGTPSEDGAIVKRSVGDGKYAYLMCTRQDWKDESDLEKQSENDEVMKSIGKEGLDCVPVNQLTGKVEVTTTSIKES